ncbi:hypothetical protein O8413_17425 [Vibrio furnissii]|uniref:hypothetical protein n=1 Tax=Vibrio furnissii TaxID=29494 RepID=UPI0024BB11FF|nr:hypothetical protein [Vibrio furnissii]WHR53933.1 hypothetical protein O8413_17425 [Vibrio furnissii]
MSVIEIYKNPSDLYMKLIREGKRTWQASNINDIADHLFNFCVTSLSLRDWCIDKLELEKKAKNDFYEMHSNNKWLKYCGDIANSSKHFALNEGRKSKVSDVLEKKETLVPLFMDGTYRNELSYERPSLEIIDEQGQAENLMMLLFWTCTEWERVFKMHDLSLPKDAVIGSMFFSVYYPTRSGS